MAIDDELDAIRSQYPESSSNLGLTLSLKLLTSLPGKAGLLFKIGEVLRSHFSTKVMSERLNILFDALEGMVRRFQQETERRLSAVEDRLNSPEFAEAYVNVANIAIFTANPQKIREFGSILGYEAASNDAEGWDEAAALIADLSRLTESDLEVLRLMVKLQGGNVRENPNDAEYNLMSAAFGQVRDEWVRQGKSRYELYSHALRLSGFGLANPLNWNQSSWGPQDMGFAPTPRGKRLVEILEIADQQCRESTA
jgi:hypothetical protein